MKRQSLTPKERALMVQAQAGLCAACGGPLGASFIAEHVLPVKLGNEAKPDALYCRPCAKAKTARDVSQIAKAKRQARYHATGKGRARSGRKLPSKPITSWRGMDGTIRRKGDA